jgi:hypothetical protein
MPKGTSFVLSKNITLFFLGFFIVESWSVTSKFAKYQRVFISYTWLLSGNPNVSVDKLIEFVTLKQAELLLLLFQFLT